MRIVRYSFGVGPSPFTRLRALMLRFHSTLPIFALALGAMNTRSAVAQDSSGFVPTRDSTRLFYQKTGRGPRTIIVPGRIFLWPTVRRLGDEFTVISYDTRDRGRSDRIDDASKITIQADVDDLEAIRSHFRIEKADVIGYSYMGMMVMLYALQHPDRVDRVVQLGPVPLRWDTQFPPELVNRTPPLVDLAATARLSALRRDPSATQRDICEAAWAVDRYGLVGDSGHVGRLGPSRCDMPNEWPANFTRHLNAQFPSVQRLTHTWAEFARVISPVLTIHGTLDRNAAYGAGREWAARLPNARLITIERAAHQSFSEYPEIVIPAIRTFFSGAWPLSAVKVSP